MTPAILDNDSNSTAFVYDSVEWPRRSAYRCHVCIIPEDDGQITAIVLNLPGTASSGDNEAEALANVEDSIRGLIAMYLDSGDDIPGKIISPRKYQQAQRLNGFW